MMTLKRIFVLVVWTSLLCLGLWGCASGGIASKSFDISGDVETNTTVEWTSEGAQD